MAGDDFLARERAALGDDATQFAGSNDKAAFMEEDDDDLLGGGGGAQGGEEMDDFQSSFPALDTTNEVRLQLEHIYNLTDTLRLWPLEAASQVQANMPIAPTLPHPMRPNQR